VARGDDDLGPTGGDACPSYRNGSSDRDLYASATAHCDLDTGGPAHWDTDGGPAYLDSDRLAYMDADPHTAARTDGDGNADPCGYAHTLADCNRDGYTRTDGDLGV